MRVSTHASLGSSFCMGPKTGVRDTRDINFSSAAPTLLQRAVLAPLLTCIHGLDPICKNHIWLCVEGGHWDGLSCSELLNSVGHGLGYPHFGCLWRDIYWAPSWKKPQDILKGKTHQLKIFLQNWIWWEKLQDLDRCMFPRAVFHSSALRKYFSALVIGTKMHSAPIA